MHTYLLKDFTFKRTDCKTTSNRSARIYSTNCTKFIIDAIEINNADSIGSIILATNNSISSPTLCMNKLQ